MNPRTTAILFIAAAALGAFVYLYEIRGEAGRLDAEEAGKRLFPGFTAEEVSEISLTTSDDRSARAERKDGAWELVEPLTFPGDAFTLDGMASALADLKRESVYEEPQPAEVYGLDDDAAVVRFVAAGASHALRMGHEAPMGSNSYASVEGEAPVYTVSSYALNALHKSLDDLREKRILRFDRNAVDHIRASWPGGRVELQKGKAAEGDEEAGGDGGEQGAEEAGWRITAPIQDEADPKTVNSLLSDLAFLRADGFVDDPPSDDDAGLAPPAFEVELSGPAADGGEPFSVSVAIGRDVGEKSRLVRAGQPSLYRVPQDWLTDVPRELVAYRWKQLAKFAPTDAQRVEIHFQPLASTAAGDAPLSLTVTRGESGWSSEPEAFAPGKVAGMLSALSNLTATDILADEMGPAELAGVGLDPPITHIVVRGEGEGEPLADVRLGMPRGDGGIAAQRQGDPTVYELDHAVGERVPISLEAFRNRFEPAAEPAATETPEAGADLPSEAAEPDVPDPALESP